MLSHALLVLSVLTLLVSMISGQCTEKATEVCTVVTTDTPSGDSITLTLTYDGSITPDAPICAVSGSLSGGSSFQGQTTAVTGFTGTGNFVTFNPTTFAVVTMNLNFATLGSTGVVAFTGPSPGAGSLVGTVQAGGATLVSYFAPSGESTLPASTDTCTAAGGGDPFFTGYMGQQFFVGGEVGGVLNILSSFNLQLNARVIFLDQGDALMPAEQERLVLLSEIRHAADPSIPVFDRTTYWSHPGNYFGEVGVSMLDGHRLYAKPGSYKNGWMTVTLDDEPLAVSDEYIVIGSGVNAITLARPTPHRIVFRTLNVEFSLVCSDHFLNVEHSHLESGWHKHKHFAGIMGSTVNPKFKWDPEMEKEFTVTSGDLFEFVAQPL